MKTWLNGQLADQLVINDRGLSYGDGLFETLQIRNGKPLLLEDHWQRMNEGLQRLKFPADTLNLLQTDLDAIRLPEEGVLKLTVTRGPGGRGYRLPDPTTPSRIIGLGPLPEFAGNPANNGIRTRLCQTRLGINPLLAGIKHLNRLEQVLARAECDDPLIAEGIVCDIESYLVEGTMSNICWFSEGALHTPILDRAGVAGIVRNRLLVIAERAGIETRQGRYSVADLRRADEVFVCNSLIDIWPVIGLDEYHYPVGGNTRRMQLLLQQEYQS